MSKLTKKQAAQHEAALKILQKDILTEEDIEFVFSNYYESQGSTSAISGAFFTPYDLALDTCLMLSHNTEATVIDLCAGIGVLGYAAHIRGVPQENITLVEINADYVEVGKKILPNANWICADAFSVEGKWDYVLSNPPFNNAGIKSTLWNGNYTGSSFDYRIAEFASTLSDYVVLILPENNVPFRYSGERSGWKQSPKAEYIKWSDQTGLSLDLHIGIDTTIYDQFKVTSVKTEVAILRKRE